MLNWQKTFCVLAFCLTANANDHQKSTSNVSGTRDAVLHFLDALAKDPDSPVLSGQNCGHGNGPQEGYRTLIEQLVENGSPRIALLGVDYGLDNDFDANRANSPLITHWGKGGFVTVSWHAGNPWTDGTSWDIKDAKLTELLVPGSKAYKRWRTDLDQVAKALQHLRDAGVVVLWRPLHEMNGNWFWWGMSAHPEDPAPFKQLWRQMHEVFTEEYGLDNLIWVYSVFPEKDPSWTRPVHTYFPGEDVVDLVGIDLYSDTIHIPDYPSLQKMGKPIALTEFGPGKALEGGGSYDNRNTINTLSARYPGIVYWLQWHDWQSEGKWVRKSIRYNQHAAELLADPRVLNVKDLNTRFHNTP